MVRFYDNNTILVNNYHADDNPEFQKKLKRVIRDSGLTVIQIHYDPYQNPNFDDATGIYINYLHMNSVIVLPTFKMKTDDAAVRQFEDLFPDHKIYSVDSRSIAKDWGILNCITWNILRTNNAC